MGAWLTRRRLGLRRKLYHSLDELQADVDAWIQTYNAERTHSGKYCYGKTPLQTFIDSAKLAYDKQLDGSSRHPNRSKQWCSRRVRQIESWLGQLMLIAIYNVNDSELVVVWLIVDQRRCARLLPLILW